MRSSKGTYQPEPNSQLLTPCGTNYIPQKQMWQQNAYQLIKDLDTYFSWGYTMDEDDSYLEELKKRIKICLKENV